LKNKSTLQPRLLEIQALALEAFGSKAKAERWLHKENFVLGTTPLLFAESDSGFIEVKKILGAIIYGGVI